MADEPAAGDIGSDESDNTNETTSSSAVDDEQDAPATNTRNWEIDRNLDTDGELKAYFEANKQWKKKTHSQSQADTKEYYYCNVNGRSPPNMCPAECVF